ncbi:MAG: hypothetical protein N3C63_03895 [Rhodocyclaceae bacterium]|nr:hypothetical protein [Rhodocyclaceae bacterium]
MGRKSGARELLIDITRLLDRAMQGRRPTGVDRVGLAYIHHFRDRAKALVRLAGRWVVCSAADSQHLFDWVVALGGGGTVRMHGLVGKNYALNWQPPRAGDILLNVVHSGLDRADYGNRVRRHGLRALYFLHDLIPIRFPEYSRPGEAERHRQRLLTMLTTAHGVVVNSLVTGRELEDFAASQGIPAPDWIVARLAPPALPPSQVQNLL